MSQYAVHEETGNGSDGPSATTRNASRRGRRTLVVTFVAVLVVGLGALVTDTVAGMRTESAISRALLASPRIVYMPEVTVGGFPVLAHRSGTFPSATITARGVPVGCPPLAGTGRDRDCRIELGATLDNAHIPRPIDPTIAIHADTVAAYLRLDSVNLGRFLRIVDLTVNTPAPPDKAGGGGPGDGLLRRTSGVVLTGTVALPPVADDSHPPSASAHRGPKVRVSVTVDLTVSDGALRISATGFYRGPQQHSDADVPDEYRDQVLSRFSATLPALRLPWGIAPTTAHSEGSDVLLAGESRASALRPDAY